MVRGAFIATALSNDGASSVLWSVSIQLKTNSPEIAGLVGGSDVATFGNHGSTWVDLVANLSRPA